MRDPSRKSTPAAGAAIGGVVGPLGGHTARLADVCVRIPISNPATITPHTESFQALVWHLLVSHPKLKVSEMKWGGEFGNPPRCDWASTRGRRPPFQTAGIRCRSEHCRGGNRFHPAFSMRDCCQPLAEIGQDRRCFRRARQVVLLARVALPVVKLFSQRLVRDVMPPGADQRRH